MQSSSRIPAIDALRALAVLSVICYHMDSSLLPGGFAGVDVFFVISGYVVTRALAQRIEVPWHTYLKDFYVRRILRIFPALLVCLLGTLVIEALLVPKSWLSSQNFDTAKWAFFGLSNIFLSANQESYFSPRIEFNPYVHTWSLGVEEQFYVLLPLLYFAQRRFGSSAWGYALRRALPALCVISFAISLYYVVNNSSLAYYSLQSRFWELGLGALLAELHRVRGTKPYASKTVITSMLAASVVLLALGLLFSDKRYFPVPYAALAVFGTLGLIDLAARRAWVTGESGAARLVVYIGTISYSLYLWHWPIFTVARWTTGLDTWATKAMALAIIALLAVASFHLVERPFQRRWFYEQKRLAVLLVGLCAIFSGALLAKGVDKARSKVTLSVTGDQRAWYPYNWSASNSATGCHSESRTQIHDGYRHILMERKSCGETTPERTIFVAGDSHAGAYETMLGRLATEHPYAVKLILMPNCPFFRFDRVFGSLPQDCQKFIRTSLSDIAKEAKPGDIVFLPSRRMAPLANQWGEVPDAPPSGSFAESLRPSLLAETTQALEPLLTSGIQVVFEAPKPVFPSPAFRCSDWFNRSNQICAGGLEVSTSTLQDRRKFVMDVLTDLRNANKLISVWDPFPILCPGSTCKAADQGVPLFFDGDHLSGGGNQRLYPSFESFVASKIE